MFDDPITAIRLGIGQPVEDTIAFRILNLVIEVTLFFVAKCFAIRNKKLEIARVRLVHMRIINLVDDAMAEREPKAAARVIGSAEALFGAGSPARLDAWR